MYRVFNTVAEAEAVAAANNADDDGWTYRVVPDPSGGPRAVVKVYDEAGEFIANL